MNINLSKEIIEIERKLFNIRNEFENSINSLFSDSQKNIFNVKDYAIVRFYDYYPYLFKEKFNDVKKEAFRVLSISGALYLRYLLLNDDLMDSKDIINPSNILYSNFLRSKSLNLLYTLFPSSSIFWKYFDKYNKEFTNAVLLERTKHFGVISPYSYSEFEIIAMGKSAMAKYVTTALALLNNSPEKIESLEKSQDYFHTAFQLNDDLEDWKEDYLNHNYSHLLTNIIYEYGLEEQVTPDNKPSLETIGKALYLSNAVENQMNNAIKYLKKAVFYGLNCALWIDNIEKMISDYQRTKNKFHDTRVKLLSKRNFQQEQKHVIVSKTKKSEPNNPLQFSIKRALDYILTNREMNLLAMKHRRSYQQSKNSIGNIENQSVYDVVFFRALLIDTLLEIKSIYTNIAEIINQEVELLLDSKLKKIKGGWRYFPEMSELPPDTDDLGQVLQALVKSKYERTEEAVSASIGLVLSQCSYDDGSFETWIIDKNDVSKEATIIKNAIGCVWSFRMGKDSEVVANLLYGLYLYNYSYLKDRINKGVNLLEKRQTKEGYWYSGWYWGNYYGIYTAIRIIKEIKHNSTTLKRAKNYLINSQNYDGGWGNVGSDPLNTSLALLSLVLLDSTNLLSISKGLNYLFSTQNPKGYWDKVEFIKMSELGSTHKSKIITTQFCLKALVAISKHTSLEKILNYKRSKNRTPQIKIHLIYESLKNILNDEKSNNEKLELITTNYLTAQNDFIDVIPSINKNRLIKKLSNYSKDITIDLINKVGQENIVKVCKESIKKCFEKLPMNKIPEIYLWIGDYSFLSESVIINGDPSIIISLEFFSDTQLSKSINKEQKDFKTRIGRIQDTIPVIIATQYAHLILKQVGTLENTFNNKLFEAGFISYFSAVTFPEKSLGSHLFITAAELDWCKRNEWFLTREIKPYLNSNIKKDIKRFFSINSKRNTDWLPNRLGYYVGYRIIEEYFKKNHTITLRDLITESYANLVTSSNFFNF